MNRNARAVAIAVVMFASCGHAYADRVSERSVHWGVGAGGFGALTGSERVGSFFDAVLYPGGRFDRVGARLEARGLGGVRPRVFLSGLTYEAGTARPTLTLALYATVGISRGRHPAAAAGVEAQLALLGPVGIGGDLSGLLIIDGTQDTELVVTGALTFRISR